MITCRTLQRLVNFGENELDREEEVLVLRAAAQIIEELGDDQTRSTIQRLADLYSRGTIDHSEAFRNRAGG